MSLALRQVFNRTKSSTVLRHLRFIRGVSGYSSVWGEEDNSPQTKPESVFSLNTRPHLISTCLYSRREEFSLSLSRTWRRYLTTSSGEDSVEVLKWYDVDTPEFSKIVTSYQEGKATAAEVTLIDVRQPEELVESGKIPGTINIPLGEVAEALSLETDVFENHYGVAKPMKDSVVIFHCKAGVRSLVAMDTANQLGYSRAKHYVRGYLGWQDYMGKGNN